VIDDPNPYASAEELRYAETLGAVVRLGFVLLIASFLAYLLRIPQPRVPMDRLPQYWSLPVDQFVKATHTPTGWDWLTAVGYSDILNLVGVAVLAAASAFSSLAVLPIFARRGEFALIAITLLQLLVLAVSASNILAVR